MYLLSLSKTLFGVYIFGCLLALSYNYWIKSQGAGGIKWTECLNPTKQFSVVIGFTFYFLIPSHVFEQIVLRVYDDYCRPNCLLGNNGKCDSCGCNTAAKMFSPLEKDSRGNWGKVLWSRKKYEELRRKYPVKVEVTYGK